MKTKYFNYNHLAEEEIHDKVIRVKGIILNSNNEILLGEAFGTIQFPGGHVEAKETLEQSLKREIKEETGLTLRGKFEPFYAIKYLMKDYPKKGHNRALEIYYYKINTDKKYNLQKASLDKQEKRGGFNLTYIPLKNLKKYLKANQKRNPINKIVNREMLLAIKNMK